MNSKNQEKLRRKIKVNELKELYETINVEVQPIWRRLSVKDKKKEQAAIALVQQKGLSYDDILLILQAFKANNQNT